ncbi:DNA-3-methyladenine glycosylase family protein [Desulfovibrio sp.]|uniref:DNA-3-methyladenine glycosylase family protein n=1 Tax=Desulfovibrio sp. TaxID=885 RepID=UPI003D0E7B2D
MSNTNYFEYGEKEKQWLSSRDPALSAAMDEIGHVHREVQPDLFKALINSIVGQQISTKAHVTIWNRMQERFAPITPENFENLRAEDIQTCGISMRKALYIKSIADAVSDGGLDLTLLPAMTDAELSASLVQLKGIGLWTAEMLMIFSMQRPDILSWDDLAIQRGLRMLYKHRKITPKLFAKYKKRYSPHASVASLYLWAIAGGACASLKDCAPAKNRGLKSK